MMGFLCRCLTVQVSNFFSEVHSRCPTMNGCEQAFNQEYDFIYQESSLLQFISYFKIELVSQFSVPKKYKEMHNVVATQC